MARRIELGDLPPKFREQAQRKLAEQNRRKAESREKAVHRSARALGGDFDSRGEYEYYIGTVLPRMATGQVVKCEKHPRFVLFPAGSFCELKLGEIQYTADFRLDYADGTVEIVEVKSRFVRRMQRDYPVRRRIFVEQIARPNGWHFTEIITEDTREQVKKWRKSTQSRDNRSLI